MNCKGLKGKLKATGKRNKGNFSEKKKVVKVIFFNLKKLSWKHQRKLIGKKIKENFKKKNNWENFENIFRKLMGKQFLSNWEIFGKSFSRDFGK